MAYSKKEIVRVMVYTARYRIEADLHIISGSRLTDIMNVKTKDFLPLTNVKILSSDEDKVLQQASYAAILRDSIIIISPLSQLEEGLMVGE
ncbi:MAG: hypothetical protein KAS39_08715 [Actinomycetia bacterium]|nr:hypothetical protein [Actinomycetes bacterium]